MKKFAIVASLLLLIIATFLFIVIRILANGSNDNYFNQHYRLGFDKSSILRNIFYLHNLADARFDYLNNSYDKILIEVDEMQGLNISSDALNLLVQKIRAITNKKTSFIYGENSISYQDSVNDNDLESLFNKYQVYSNSSKAYVHLMYLSQYDDQNTMLGSTFHDNGIILFDSALREFTKSSPDTLDNYTESTALHEFGHQLGLDHNEQEGCLMNSHAEQAHVALENPENVVTDFCDYEKQLINTLR